MARRTLRGAEGSLSSRERRLRVLPGAADPHADSAAADTPAQRARPTPTRRKRRRPVPPEQTVAPAENATSIAPQGHTARPRANPAKRGRVAALAAVPDGKRLGVRPAAFVPGNAERRSQAREALAVLYRDFLAGGGLDVLADRRSHATPANDARPRRAA